MKIAIVAGEASGDRLAAGLIDEIREREPAAAFFGMAGPAMRAHGCRADYDINELSVMGIVEVLRRYPELKRLQKRVARQLAAARPDLFISVDAPDFTLGIARAMKGKGIPTVHYVSPTVWAWRAGRARTVAASADMLLSIFPFEAAYYENLPVDYRFVGHYVADEIATRQDRAAARAELGIDASATLLVVLPGSRPQELAHHCADFAATAALLRQARPDLQVLWSALDERGRDTISRVLADAPGGDKPRIVSGITRTALAAADIGLVVSGTVTLEALLLRCPFVAAYRTSPWTYRIARRLVRVPHIAMANILAGKRLVPEFLQDEVRPEAMARALLDWLEAPERVAAFRTEAAALHLRLRRNASARAAEAVLELAAARGGMPP